jgi:hypothetical protein
LNKYDLNRFRHWAQECLEMKAFAASSLTAAKGTNVISRAAKMRD